MKKTQLSIIIVNYNGKHYLSDCIESIKLYCESVFYEIIILDNNSSDGSQEYIKSNYPEIHLITKSENLGFAKGNNEAVKKSSGEKILFLNNDTVLLDNVSPALELLNKNEVGIVGIKMLDEKRNYRKSAGNFPNLMRLVKFSKLFINKRRFVTGNFTDEIEEVDWIEASFLLTTRSCFNQIGGFSEDYFMYVEDVDFCKKVSLIGKKTIYFPEISYVHYGGFNKSRQNLLIEGYKIYTRKYFNSLKIVGILILNFKKALFSIVK